jgi:hypothetical protein
MNDKMKDLLVRLVGIGYLVSYGFLVTNTDSLDYDSRSVYTVVLFVSIFLALTGTKYFWNSQMEEEKEDYEETPSEQLQNGGKAV